MNRRWLGVVPAVVVVGALWWAGGAWAATDVVTNPSGSAATAGSLPYEVANASPGDTITFASSLDGQTISLSSPIAIGENLTIQGPGADELTVSGGGNSQIFTVSSGDVSISGLTLSDGAAGGPGGNSQGSGEGSGGAIYESGNVSLSVTADIFSHDSAGGPGAAGEYSGDGKGGAIYDGGSGTLTVSGSTFTGNSAGGPGAAGFFSGEGVGGAIYDIGSVSVSGSTFTGNSAGGPGANGVFSGLSYGGAIYGDGSVSVSGSTFTGDSAGGQGANGVFSGLGIGGAILDDGSGSVSGSTFTGNSAGGQGNSGCGSGLGFGGAILVADQSVSVSDNTIAGNSAGGPDGTGANSGYGYGGALDVGGLSESCTSGNTTDGLNYVPASAATLSGDTIDGNSASQAGSGIYGAGVVSAQATIVSGDTGSSNCDASVMSSSFDLEYGAGAPESSCGFDLPSLDPMLGPLRDNGGPTETQALAAASPAVDVVPRGQADCPASGESSDQRGFPRPDNGEYACDIGAYELQDQSVGFSSPKATQTSVSSSPDPAVVERTVTLTASITPAPDGGTVSFSDPGRVISGCGAVPVNHTTGKATCTTRFSAAGRYGIQAVFSGDRSFKGSKSPTITQVVTKKTTSLRLRTSADPARLATRVTYSTQLSPVPSGGWVTFLQDGQPIRGCVNLPVNSAGKATCQWSYTRAGARTIKARYTGTPQFSASTSNTLTETVNKNNNHP